MARYLDPKADVVFKKVFGEHPHLLKSFLNALLPLSPDREIVELSYLPQESIPSIPTMKRTVADVRCTDAQGRMFIVEMQINWTDSFKQRLLFESGQAIVKQLEKGEDYCLLQPVYGLGLIASNFDPDPQSWYHHYQLVNRAKPDTAVIEHLQLIFIELLKFPAHSPETKKLRLLWLRFMREINDKTQDIDAALLAVPEIKEAVQLTREAAYNLGELNAYDAYWDAVSREKTLLSGWHTKGLQEGERKGIQKGREEGLQQGLQQGLEQGLQQGRHEGELNARLMIAKHLLQHNTDLALITEATGLSEAELRKL